MAKEIARASSMQWLDGKEVTEAEYKAEMDLRTMIEAEKIKKDQKRLKACMARKKKLMKTLDSLMGKDMNYSHNKPKKKMGSSHASY